MLVVVLVSLFFAQFLDFFVSGGFHGNSVYRRCITWFLFNISSMLFAVVGFLIGAPFGSSLGVSFWGTFKF